VYAEQLTKERAIFTKEQADYYNSLTLDELVDKMSAKCGHNDPLGYFTGLPCGACTRKAHAQATGGKA